VNTGYKIIRGKVLVLLVAGHNYPQLRGGNLKSSDLYTGKLVEKLASKTKSWAIISEEIQLDPNWYSQSPFRLKVKQLIKDNDIKAVFDIHGKKDSDNLIEVYPNKNFKKLFTSSLSGFLLKNFKDNDQLTISEDLGRTNIPSLEVEIRKDGRIPGTKENQEILSLLSNLLIKVVSFLSKN